MTDDPIRGVVVPILTPLTPQERVDTGSLRRLVAYLLDNGVHGIWAAGTTSEFAALSDAARTLSIEPVVDEVRGRVPTSPLPRPDWRSSWATRSRTWGSQA